jgi:hypothetical protein
VRQRRTRLATVALIGSVILVAGCGSSSGGSGAGAGGKIGTGSNNSSQPPAAELASAVSALGNTSSLTTTFKLAATPSVVTSFAQAHNDTITSAEASAIATAQVSLELAAPAGKTVADIGTGTGPAAFDLTVGTNGTTYVSLRSVNKTLYLQANLKDLLTTIGKAGTFTSLQSESAGLPSFVQALLTDKWVSLPESTLRALESTLGSGSSSSTPPSSANGFQVISELRTILTSGVTVKRLSAGSTDKLASSANLKAFATSFLGLVAAAVPAAGSALGGLSATGVPDEQLAITESVTGAALSELSIDLGQFDHQSAVTLPLNVLFSGGNAITVPSGAVAIDASQLGELFAGLAGGFGSSSNG